LDFRKAKKIHYLLFTFMGLFHEKFVYRFRQETICEDTLKKNHKKIINVLYQHDQITLTEIGKLLDIEKGSLTTLIDSLEEKDFVTRLNDPTDRRKTLLTLSPKGKEEMEKVMNVFAQRIDESLHKFDPEEIEKFQQSLEYVVNILKKV
jgi:MarR family transcriptional regulator, organic hydroperoxide resistance regulator